MNDQVSTKRFMVLNFPVPRKLLAIIMVMMLAAAAVAASAGITGDNPAVVQEPLILSDEVGNGKLVNSNGTSSDLVIFSAKAGFLEATGFAGAAQTFPGDSYSIKVLVVNSSNKDVIQRLAVEAPPGFSFAVEGGTNLATSQESSNTFLVRVDKDANGVGTLVANEVGGTFATDELRITVNVRPGVVPGFYRVGFVMSQFDVGSGGGD